MRKNEPEKPRITDLIDENGRVMCRTCTTVYTYAGGRLSAHLRKSHSMTVQEYYKTWQPNELLWLCKCGCDQHTKWESRGGYFIDFVNGHNFKGKTKENDPIVAQRADKMKQHENWKASTWQNGHKPWNAGFTCETSETVKRCVNALVNWKQYATVEKIADVKFRTTQTIRQNFATGKRVSGFSLLSPEQRTNARKKAMLTMAQRGTFPNSKKFKTGRHLSTKSGDTFFYGSSYELERMKSFDADEQVVSWSRCKDLIEFVSTEDGKHHHYNPDFELVFCDGRIVIEEVKGIITQATINKANAAFEYYAMQTKDYRIIMKLRYTDKFVEVALSELQTHKRNINL